MKKEYNENIMNLTLKNNKQKSESDKIKQSLKEKKMNKVIGINPFKYFCQLETE